MIYSIEQIKRLRSQITPERWTYYEQQNGFAEWGQPDPPPVYVVRGPDFSIDNLHEGAIDHEPDAEFITRAPEAVDWLLARIEALETALNFYGDEGNWEYDVNGAYFMAGEFDSSTIIEDDRGKAARKALGGES
jgi:hypothetical protein